MSYVQLVMRSDQDWSTYKKAREFLDLLISQEGFMLPQKYGLREPAQFAFEVNNLENFIKFWRSGTATILLRRKKPFPIWMDIRWYYQENQLFNHLTAGIDEVYLSTEINIRQLLTFARKFYEWGNVTHGYIAHQQDWNAKNYFGVETRIAGGKSAMTGGLRLQEGLPGIYWANFFGPQYTQFIGQGKFYTTPAYYKEELSDGGILILTASSPLDYNLPEVGVLEEEIITHLGREAFFERTNPTKLCLVPQFNFNQIPFGQPLNPIIDDPVSRAIPDLPNFIEQAIMFAEALVQQFNGQLDYSVESLKQLDDLILKKSRRVANPWEKEEGRQLVQELTAYYGEVLRRGFNGTWLILPGTGGDPHPVISFQINGKQQVEYPFARVSKMWSERTRADGLFIQYYFLKRGDWARMEQHLETL